MPTLAALVPLGSSLPAAIALTAVYTCLSTYAYGLFAIWRYAPYLDAALGAGGEWRLGCLRRPPIQGPHSKRGAVELVCAAKMN